jgi:hypothetical protein
MNLSNLNEKAWTLLDGRPNRRTQLSLTPALSQAIKERAKENHRSMGAEIRLAMAAWLTADPKGQEG